MAKKRPKRALSGKALELFDNAFNATQSNSPHSYEAFVEASRLFDQLGEQGLLALPLLLNDPNTKKGCFAASAVLFANEQRHSLFERKDLTTAARIINGALQSADEDLQQWACALLSHGVVPKEAVPLLRELVRRGGEATKILAAITLCGCRTAKVVALQTIRRALGSSNPAESALAATAIARMHVTRKVLTTAFAEIHRMNDEGRVAFLDQLQFCTRVTRPQFRYLATLIRDTKISPATRRAAIRVASQVTPTAELAAEVLMEALACSDELVVDAAIEGLDRLGAWPDTATGVLQKHLEADHVDMRRVGAKGLKLLGPRAIEATECLIRRGRRERNIFVLQEIAAALVAIGPSTVSKLAQLLAGHDVSEHSLGQTALLQLGEASCVELAKVLIDPNAGEPVRKTILAIFMYLAEKAEAAIPLIAQALDETTDEDTCVVALGALFNCAQVAQAAVPALARRLVGSDERIAGLARTVLLQIGVTAIRALDKVVIANDREADIVGGLVFCLETGLDAAYKYLAHIPRHLLEVFVVLGDLSKEGLGEEKCSERIKQMITNGELHGPAFRRVSGPTLGGRVRTLQSRLPKKVFRKGTRRRRVLTTYGAELLEVAKAYLLATRFT
jgi:hypothetical protein